MRFESIKTNICKGSLVKLSSVQSVKEKVQERYKLFSDLKSELGNSTDKVEDIINTCKADLKVLEKLERKATKYKKITIEKDGDYESSIIRIIFPKGTKMKFKKEWLYANDYPLKTIYYKISSMYDCTGKVHTVYVAYKGNVVEIESLYDV